MNKFENQEGGFSEDTFGMHHQLRTPLSQASNFTFNPGQTAALLLSPLVLSPLMPHQSDRPKSRWDPNIKLFELEELSNCKAIYQSQKQGEGEGRISFEQEKEAGEEKKQKETRQRKSRIKKQSKGKNAKGQRLKQKGQQTIDMFLKGKKTLRDSC